MNLRQSISFIWLSAYSLFDRLIWEMICSKRPSKELRRLSLLALIRAFTSSPSIGMATARRNDQKKPLNLASAKGARLVLKPRWTSCAILPLIYTTASLAMMFGPKAQALWYLVPKKYLLYLFIYFAGSIVRILFSTHNLKTDFSLMQSKSIQTKSSIWTTRQSSSLADPLLSFSFWFVKLKYKIPYGSWKDFKLTVDSER